MGIVASNFAKASVSDGWSQLGRGPRLRQIFGAYGNQDCWGVQRRFRQIDDGNGYVSYEELQMLIGAEEHMLLFIWDLFSQQNELIDIKELLSVVCFFSSATLEEKGKFLLTLYDESKCSVCTAAEIAKLCTMLLGMLARCTGSPAVKVKELSSSLKQDLPDLLPAYREAVQLAGENGAFNNERVIHLSELRQLLKPIQSAYERLSVSRAPPADSPPPPPPEWGINVGGRAGNEGGAGKARAPRAPDGTSATQEFAMSKPAEEDPHLAWMSRLDDDPVIVSPSNAGAEQSARRRMLMRKADFATIAKDVPAFHQMFSRSVCTSLGLPSGCVEVVGVTMSMGADYSASTVVEFYMHSPGDGARPISTVLLLLDQQLKNRHSALRNTELGVHLYDAELMAAEAQSAEQGA